MKLRIYNNHIRLRLTRTEVTRLADSESIEGRVALLPEPLVYQLSAASSCKLPAVVFQRGNLQITLPLAAAQQWASTDQVGIEAFLPTVSADHPPVQLLIEKDFKCLHVGAGDQPGEQQENQEDCFANPNA